MNAQINTDRLNAKFRESLSTFDATYAAKPKKTLDGATEAVMTKAVGFAGVSFPDIGGAVDTFCAAWPKVRPLLNTGLKFASWVLPAKQIALAKAVLAVIDAEIIPAVCGPQT